MTVAILVADGSSDLTTYDGLVTAVSTGWLKNSGLADRAPDFLALAEARFNRVLPVSAREQTTTLTTTAETIDLPDDFAKARALFLDNDPRRNLDPLPLAVLRTYYAAQASGEPASYAISGTSLILGPAPDAEYDLILTYEATIPALTSSNQTNWLSLAHPDIYLYGTLLQAEFFGWNDDRLPTIKAALDEALSELIGASNRARYGAAPLRMRPSVIERL